MQRVKRSKPYETLAIFISAILAGMSIGIGGTAWLLCDRYIGALLFCVGLFTICSHGMWLFTGKVGYLVVQDNEVLKYTKKLCATWIGNFVGALLIGFMISTARSDIIVRAYDIVEARMTQSIPNTISLSVLCGVLMFVAVNSYNAGKNAIGILLCVPTFLLCGFEHSIADMFFFATARAISPLVVAHLTYVTLGNAIGSIIICAGVRAIEFNANRA